MLDLPIGSALEVFLPDHYGWLERQRKLQPEAAKPRAQYVIELDKQYSG